MARKAVQEPRLHRCGIPIAATVIMGSLDYRRINVSLKISNVRDFLYLQPLFLPVFDHGDLYNGVRTPSKHLCLWRNENHIIPLPADKTLGLLVDNLLFPHDFKLTKKALRTYSALSVLFIPLRIIFNMLNEFEQIVTRELKRIADALESLSEGMK